MRCKGFLKVTHTQKRVGAAEQLTLCWQQLLEGGVCLLFRAEVVRRWKHACNACVILEYADVLGYL